MSLCVGNTTLTNYVLKLCVGNVIMCWKYNVVVKSAFIHRYYRYRYYYYYYY